MSILSKLFGGGTASAPKVQPETYQDYRIVPNLMSETGGYRIAGRIEKEIEGEVKVHDFVRADVCQSHEEALRLTIVKAKLIIDEQGDAIFG